MINNVTLMGRIVCDIDKRVTTSNKEVATFRIAVKRSFSKSDESDFITIVCWEGQANFVEKYFHKGDMIAIQGSIRTRSYEDKDGKKRTAFEVVAREVSFCGGKNDNAPAQASTSVSVAPDVFEEIGANDDLPF